MKHTHKILLACLMLNTFFMSSQLGNVSVGLSACYDLNGQATDFINSLNGTLSAVSATTDRLGNAGAALAFSGNTTSLVRLPASSLIKPSPAVSVSGWFKVTGFVNNSLIIFTKNSFASHIASYALQIQNNGGGYKFAAWRQDGSKGEYVEGTTVISLNTWYHVAFSIDNSAMNIYVNGLLENTIACSIPNFNYDASKGVILGGTDEAASNTPFNGCVDNLRFYSRAITLADVSELYGQDPVCKVSLLPAAAFSVSSKQICEGESLTLNDLSTNTPTAWLWTAPGGFSQNGNSSAPTFTFNNPGVYTISLTVSNSFGMSLNTATTSIIVNSKPLVTASASSTNVCAGSAIQFTAGGAISYTWMNQFPGTTYSTTANTNVVYFVTGAHVNGCKNSASVTININPLPVVTASVSDAEICKGDIITFNAAGAATYLWSSQHTSASFTLSPAATGIYTVTGIDLNGCVNKATKAVLVNANPAVTASAGRTLACPGENVKLTATGAAKYLWSNNITAATFSTQVFSTTSFTVTGTNLSGCQNSAVVQVVVIIDCDPLGLEELNSRSGYYPNPVIDKFRVSTCMAGEFTVEIYSLEGKRLLSVKRSDNDEPIDMSWFAPGVYILKITGVEAARTLKLSKQ